LNCRKPRRMLRSRWRKREVLRKPTRSSEIRSKAMTLI